MSRTHLDEARGEPLGPDELAQAWDRVRKYLRDTIQRQQFDTWFRRAALIAADDERVVLAVHNNFTRTWLIDHYAQVVADAVRHVFGDARRVEFVVDPENAAAIARQAPPLEEDPPPIVEAPAPPPQQAAAPPPPTSTGRTQGSRALLGASDIELNAEYRFDTFVVGPCNRFAHAACVGVSENPGSAYNPLFLHGNVGLGKTHLLQSLCRTILDRNAEARILYLSCETFVNHFISALENGDLERFRTKYRNVDLLVVDDIHLLANKERTQEEFFHTFNTLYNAGKQIVLSSDSPPKDIPTLQDRLVSRFKWGLVTEMEAPCFETRMAILRRKSRERGRELPEDVAKILAERIDSNVRELEGAVTKVLSFSALSGQPVTPGLVRQCLQELFAVRRGQPSIEDVLRIVTDHFDVKLSELQSRKRTQAIAFPRQIAMYLARRITSLSLEEIGGYFGGRDHSTVLYGVQKITNLAKQDTGVQRVLAELVFELQGDGTE